MNKEKETLGIPVYTGMTDLFLYVKFYHKRGGGIRLKSLPFLIGDDSLADRGIYNTRQRICHSRVGGNLEKPLISRPLAPSKFGIPELEFLDFSIVSKTFV